MLRCKALLPKKPFSVFCLSFGFSFSWDRSAFNSTSAHMRRTPSRPTSGCSGANPSSPNGYHSQAPYCGGGTNGRLPTRTTRSVYTDLDWVHVLPDDSATSNRISNERPEPRVCRQPEVFLIKDNSSVAMKKLPEVARPETAAAEESILKKWEAWSTQMGTQLALESAVPTTPLARGTSRNGSFRSGSQVSNNSMTRPRPESGRRFSPLSQSGRRSISRGSSRSRQSSLASTVVEPFRVGDRMTASAERKRHRPQSTKGSRELLFRRALGLEEDKHDVQNLSTTSSSRRNHHVPSPLIATPRATSTPRKPTGTHRPIPVEGGKEEALTTSAQTKQKDMRQVSKPTETTFSPQAALPTATLGSNVAAPQALLSEPDGMGKGEDKTDKWLQKTIALLSSEDHPYNEVLVEKSTSSREKSDDAPLAPKAIALEPVLEKWHLPLEEAARMVCGRVVVQTIDNCPTPSIEHPKAQARNTVDLKDSAFPYDDAAPQWSKWSIDRASVNVLFVDHHVDDDQLSAYGVEVPSREECSHEVLSDWNESRRRFAPAPIEDSQLPQ